MNQRYFFFIGIIVTIIIVAGVVFYLTLPKNASTTVVETGTFEISDDYIAGEETSSGEQPLGQVGGQAGEEVAPKLFRITDGPVAFGVSVASTLTPTALGTSTVTKKDIEVRYIERRSGNAYAYKIGDRTLTRISNRTLPGVYEASWLSDGSLAYVRFLGETNGEDVLETYALPLDQKESGYFLEPNLSEVLTKGTTTVLTLLKNTNGSIATIASPEGTEVKTFFSSLLSNLQLGFSGKNLVAYTNASGAVNGYSFLVDSATGNFERIAGPSRGLTALPSPKGTYVLHTYLSGSALRSELFETKTRTSTPIPIGTIAEKCVWATDESALYCAAPRTVSGNLPDDWYQGVVSFSDRLWQIDLEGRVALLVVDPSSVADVSIDAVSLALSPETDVLVFTNKRDGSLWAYTLTP